MAQGQLPAGATVRLSARQKKPIAGVAASVLAAARYVLSNGTEWHDQGATHFGRAVTSNTVNPLICGV